MPPELFELWVGILLEDILAESLEGFGGLLRLCGSGRSGHKPHPFSTRRVIKYGLSHVRYP